MIAKHEMCCRYCHKPTADPAKVGFDIAVAGLRKQMDGALIMGHAQLPRRAPYLQVHPSGLADMAASDAAEDRCHCRSTRQRVTREEWVRPKAGSDTESMSSDE